MKSRPPADVFFEQVFAWGQSPANCASDRRGEDAGVLELGTQVADQRLDLELLAGDPPQQLPRLERTPRTVHVLPQPVAQRGELAALDLRVELGQVGAQAAPELG